jgi:nucleotide-binding universal stress UspA family protein
MSNNTGQFGYIVVGIDGSRESKVALQWAVAEAKLRGATVRAVMAWMSPYRFVGLDASVAPPMDDIEEQAEKTLAHTIAKALGDNADGSPALDVRLVESVVSRGSPSTVLLDASKGADLLVVGARGFGGFLGLILGSTADQVVKHATCPVVVVRGEDSE